MGEVKWVYDLGLHEVTYVNDEWKVIRVPGGWIYSGWDNKRQDYIRDTYVPFNNDFQLTYIKLKESENG